MRFKSMNTARKFAIRVAVDRYNRYRSFDSFYGYRCVCGAVHLTHKRGSELPKNVLLARLRAPRALVERAFVMGALAGMSEVA